MIFSRKKIYGCLEAFEVILKVFDYVYSKIRTKLIGYHTYRNFAKLMNYHFLKKRIVAIDVRNSLKDLIFGIRMLLLNTNLHTEKRISRIIERMKGVTYRPADNSITTVTIFD